MEYWIPVVTALVAVLGGAVAYWNQKRIDRRADLLAKRRDAYEKYLRAYLYTDTAARLEELNLSRMTISLVASDRVLRAMAQLDDYAIVTSEPTTPRDSERFTDLMTDVVQAMRQDVFEKTSLSAEELKMTLPIR